MRFVWGVALGVLPALAFLFVPFHVVASPLQLLHKRESIGDWQFTVLVDQFSGARRCKLLTRESDLVYARAIATIRLHAVPDLSETTIRIDGGAPLRWRDLLPQLARLDPSFVIGRNPQHLAIPAEAIKNASIVWISPAFGKHARAYHVAGFDAALKRAAEFGCQTDAAFVL